MSFEANDDVRPNTSIAFIVSYWGSVPATGSGVLVGRNDVLTASHVIYNASLGGLADRIEVYFSFDPADGIAGQSYYESVDQLYYTNADPDGDGFTDPGDGLYYGFSGSEIDIALLTLNQAAGDTYGWYGIDYNFRDGYANITGHPGVYGNRMITDSGYVYRDVIDNYIHTSSLEINQGQSGGPIWHGSSENPQVVGVVSTGGAAASVVSHQNWLSDAISSNDGYITTTPTTPVIDAPANAVFRFYNTETGVHFYTGSSDERDWIISTMPALQYEGTNFGAASHNSQYIVDVHRLFNSDTGTHFYTSNTSEAQSLSNLSNFTYEGAAYQAYDRQIYLGFYTDTDRTEVAPLHRFFNNETGTHFYTASSEEQEYVNTLGQMTYEGVAYYVELL